MGNGQQVTIREFSQSTVATAALTLSDGIDYATAALESGHAKYLANFADTTYAAALQSAETSARGAGTGLWGPPCGGTIDAPAPVPQPGTSTPPPAPAAPAPTTVDPTSPPPPATTSPRQDADVVTYRNCVEVRAAGKAPLLRGQPGYSGRLDRDGDGVACEPKR